jgi:hypothetical protein
MDGVPRAMTEVGFDSGRGVVDGSGIRYLVSLTPTLHVTYAHLPSRLLVPGASHGGRSDAGYLKLPERELRAFI